MKIKNKRHALEIYMREKNQMIFDICEMNLYNDNDFKFPYDKPLENVSMILDGIFDYIIKPEEDHFVIDFLYAEYCPQCYIYTGYCDCCPYENNRGPCSNNDSYWRKIRNKFSYFLDDTLEKDFSYLNSINNFIKWNRKIV